MKEKDARMLTLVVVALLGTVGGYCICEYPHIGQDYEIDRLNEKVSALEEQRDFSERIHEIELQTAQYKGWSEGVDVTVGVVATKPPICNHDILGNYTPEKGVVIVIARGDGGELYAWQIIGCCQLDAEMEKCVEKS